MVDLLLRQRRADRFSFRAFKHSDLVQFGSFFSGALTEDSNGRLDIDASALSLFWFKLEADVEVDESRPRVWSLGTRLPGIVGSADSGMHPTALFFSFRDFFRGSGMLRGLNRSLVGDIGSVVLSGPGSRPTHPAVQRAPRWRGGCRFH